MITKQRNNNGFSLVELLVTITIITVLSGSATVGFRYLGDTMRTQQAAGVVNDTIKLLELELLQDLYTESRIYFLDDYLVVVSDAEGDTLDLSWGGYATANCSTDGEIGIRSDGNLNKLDQDGVPIAITAETSGSTKCIDFAHSEEEGWIYKLSSGAETSNLIRFIHFNVNRDNPSEITLYTASDYSIKRSAPYAKKQIYDGANPIGGPIDIEVLNSEGETESTITIN